MFVNLRFNGGVDGVSSVKTPEVCSVMNFVFRTEDKKKEKKKASDG